MAGESARTIEPDLSLAMREPNLETMKQNVPLASETQAPLASARKAAPAASLADRVDLLFALGRTTSRTALAAAVVTFLLFRSFGSSPALWVWLVLVTMANLARLAMFEAYRRRSKAHTPEAWLALHLWSGVVAGLTWGLLPLHPTAGLEPVFEAVLIVVPTTIATGAISAYSVFPSHYGAFLIAVFGTCVLSYVWKYDTSAIVPAVVLGFIGVALMGLARRYHGHIFREMETRGRLKAVNDRLSETNRELARHHELARREQDLAAHVYRHLTSGAATDIGNVATWNQPVSDFSGDLALTARGPGQRIYLMLCDFTGHGLPAALGAVPAAQIFLAMAHKGFEVGAIAAELQQRLATLLPVGYFSCAGLVCFDTAHRQLHIWNAGLPPALLRRYDDSIVEFRSGHLPLGVCGDSPDTADAATTDFRRGDSFLLLTDGLIELTDPHGEQWGLDRLKTCLVETSSADFAIPRLQQATALFTRGTPAVDDVSVIEILAADPATAEGPGGPPPAPH